MTVWGPEYERSAMTAERRAYWRAEVEKCAVVVNRWHRDNTSFWTFEDTADLIARAAEKQLQAALRVIDDSSLNADEAETSVRAYIAGAYEQVKTPAPSWKEPFKQTAKDFGDGAADLAQKAATYGSAGAGFALVIVGALWLLSRRA